MLAMTANACELEAGRGRGAAGLALQQGGRRKVGPTQCVGDSSPITQNGTVGYNPLPMTNKALSSILPIAGWSEKRAGEVEITGSYDPILATPFKITETGTATLAAVGLAVSDLWELRTGRRQGISIDTRRATASLRSGSYLKLNGKIVSNARNPVMGMYPAKNGRWSYVHANFPNHREAALKVLGVPEDTDAVRKAVAKWDALELEEAIIAAKGAGGMVRSIEEWKKHPQGIAVASLPLMEIIKIGDSKPEPLPKGDRPLSGIRILDLTRVIAGQHARARSPSRAPTC